MIKKGFSSILWSILRPLCGVLIIGIMIVAAACGKSPAGMADETKMGKSATDYVTVENYSFTGTTMKSRVPLKPERIIVCGMNAADTLLAFGAGDSVCSMVLEDPTYLESYKKRFPHAAVHGASLSQEGAIALRPDFILAMRRFFGPQALEDTVFWQQNGIGTYIQDASGPIPSLGNFPACTVESEENFLRNMGTVFGQEKQAQDEITGIRRELERYGRQSADGKRPRVLVVEFMPNNIEVFGKNLLSGDIVTKLGGDIVDYKAPFISMEELLTAESDIIFIVHHGGKEEERNALAKIREGQLRKLKAVKENRVYPLPYKRLVAPGIHTAETVRYIGQCMYPDK